MSVECTLSERTERANSDADVHTNLSVTYVLYLTCTLFVSEQTADLCDTHGDSFLKASFRK